MQTIPDPVACSGRAPDAKGFRWFLKRAIYAVYTLSEEDCG
jgi:hypothetical protein